MRISRMLALMRREADARGAPVHGVGPAVRGSPFRILVFTLLSARTKDETTIGAAKRLFAKAETPRAVVKLGEKRVAELVYPVGFYRTKAKHLVQACRALGKEHGGKVPDTLEGLMSLPGVGRKTANIVLNSAFGKPALGVDVHVHRISNRLGLVETKKPAETEKALMEILKKSQVRTFNHVLVAFGQTVCRPKAPLCPECPLKKECPKIGVKRRR